MYTLIDDIGHSFPDIELLFEERQDQTVASSDNMDLMLNLLHSFTDKGKASLNSFISYIIILLKSEEKHIGNLNKMVENLENPSILQRTTMPCLYENDEGPTLYSGWISILNHIQKEALIHGDISRTLSSVSLSITTVKERYELAVGKVLQKGNQASLLFHKHQKEKQKVEQLLTSKEEDLYAIQVSNDSEEKGSGAFRAPRESQKYDRLSAEIVELEHEKHMLVEKIESSHKSFSEVSMHAS